MRRIHFKKSMALLLALAACALLSGCTQSLDVENQAYVLVMGVDEAVNEGIQLTIRYPRISGGGSNSEAGSAGGDYGALSISAGSYEAALEKLDWAVGRSLNLSQLKLVVISEDMARSGEARQLLCDIAQTERLFNAAYVAICDSSAADFVNAIEQNIGSRLSMELNAMFEMYTRRGYVPNEKLADIYYQTISVYSDPMAAYARLAQKTEDGTRIDPPAQTVNAVESNIQTRYLGAALLRDGRVVGLLDAEEMTLTALLRNDTKYFEYLSQHQIIRLTPSVPVQIHVHCGPEITEIDVHVQLETAVTERIPDKAQLEAQLTADIEKLIARAQQLGVEPFGFAEYAAAHFPTLQSWMAYDWHTHFSQARLNIRVDLSTSNA